MDYLDQFDLKALPEDARRLLWLCYSLINVVLPGRGLAPAASPGQWSGQHGRRDRAGCLDQYEEPAARRGRRGRHARPTGASCRAAASVTSWNPLPSRLARTQPLTLGLQVVGGPTFLGYDLPSDEERTGD